MPILELWVDWGTMPTLNMWVDWGTVPTLELSLDESYPTNATSCSPHHLNFFLHPNHINRLRACVWIHLFISCTYVWFYYFDLVLRVFMHCNAMHAISHRPLELLKSDPSKHMGNKVSPQIIPPENNILPPFHFSLRYWTVDVASPQMAQGAGPALAFVE